MYIRISLVRRGFLGLVSVCLVAGRICSSQQFLVGELFEEVGPQALPAELIPCAVRTLLCPTVLACFHVEYLVVPGMG